MSDVGPPPPHAPLPPPNAASPTAAPSVILLIIQILLGIFLVFTLLVLPVTGAIVGLDGAQDSVATNDTVQTSAAALFISTIIFQFVQGSYPLLSSLRRDSTIKRDWRFAAEWPTDIGYGVGLAFACLVAAQALTVGVARLVGLGDSDDAANTDILTDNQGSIWIVGIVVLVVVGAPLAEELLFRGYLLRTLEKYIGSVLAIVLSSFLFAIPHWQPGATWQETAVLLTALGGVGLVLAIGAVLTDRLAPSIIAHAIFNGVGTFATLI